VYDFQCKALTATSKLQWDPLRMSLCAIGRKGPNSNLQEVIHTYHDAQGCNKLERIGLSLFRIKISPKAVPHIAVRARKVGDIEFSNAQYQHSVRTGAMMEAREAKKHSRHREGDKEGHRKSHRSRNPDEAATVDSEERRRLKKEARQREKMIARLAELGLDEHGEKLDNFSILKYPVREWKFSIPGSSEQIALNPAVSLMGIFVLWSLVGWASGTFYPGRFPSTQRCESSHPSRLIHSLTADPEGSLATLSAWQSVVDGALTWLFQGSKAVFLFFVLYIVYKYGHIHLGQSKDDKPEYSALAYFCMVFAAGVGPVFLTTTASETLQHRYNNFYAQAGYQSQDEIDMFAINMGIGSWTLSAWVTFVFVAIASALAVHRFGLPSTLRSCFYPILGSYTWGWIGDAIDGLAIVLMMLSVTLSLCFTTMDITDALMALGLVDEMSSEGDIKMVQKTTVWLMTIVSIASVFSGVHGGIKYMALSASTVAVFLVLYIFASDDSKFLLNLHVQAIGYHIQYSLIQINFWTDAFGQLEEGSGRAIDGKAAEQSWMA
jgi:BCCT, betaine/carnitine/choline family transporter